MPMNEQVLNNELDKLTYDATGNNAKFIEENAELLRRYNGEPYGDELPERSKVISNDVMDVVEADMPSLARVFVGPGEILKFKPNTSKEEDVKEAEDKTKYVDWQIRHQPWSYEVLMGFIKNAEIQKISVVKYFIEETTEVEEHKKTGISDTELAEFMDSLQGEDVTSVDIDREEEGDEENTVVIKVERTTKQVRVEDVQLENFRMTRNAKSKDSAQLVGDVSVMTRGELIAKGVDKSIVESIPLRGNDEQNTSLPTERNRDEGGTDDQVDLSVWASEEVEVEDLYPLIDYDEDDISERRHIMRSGDVIIENEVFNHVPYAIMPAILMPHKVVGKSRAEITAPTARAKTAILRGVQDNIYAVNSPRMGINKNVNQDDLLVIRPNGLVRSTKDTPISNDIIPITVPYIGDKALQVIQYWDHSRAQSTGSLMASQGLNADDIGKETATRFEGIEDASQSKVELVARTMAETGFRQLYEGVAWLDSNFQNTEVEIEVLGEELRVNPGDWRFKHHTKSQVGLGAGDNEQTVQSLTGLWVMHQQLKQMNSPMTDEVKRYNIAKALVKAAGFTDEMDFFNNPEKPEDLTLAQNEIMTQLVEELQGQIKSLENPLAEAETIKARAKLIEAQGSQSLEVGKMQEEQRQFNAKLLQQNEEFMKTMAAKLTELELKYGQDVPGATV